MKKLSFYTALVLGVFFGIGVANASLVGDEVTVGHYYPDISSTTLNGGGGAIVTNVADGTSDIVSLYMSYPYAYDVNVNADRILITYPLFDPNSSDPGIWPSVGQSGHFEGGSFIPDPVSFNGLGVTNLDDSSHTPLSGVSVDTNMAGWDSPSMLSFGSDYVFFDWKGLSFNQNTFFNATLVFGDVSGGDPAPVPEPGTMMLLGSGLVGLAGWGRKRIKR